MSHNRKVLRTATNQLGKAKAPAKPKDIIVDPMGQWKYPGQNTRIPGSDITMQGVNYPVFAQPNVGQPQMMYPGQEYQFPGADYVDEFPQMQEGGVSPLEGNLISKVIMNRNKGVDFVDRAYALGANPGTPMFNVPDDEEFGSWMSHKMSTGEDDNGQAWMFPTVMNPNNEAIVVPNQYADYISSTGYKNATGMIPEEDYIEAELSDDEIEEYRKGGYIVEDIAVPSLTQTKKGGIPELPLREGRKAYERLSYTDNDRMAMAQNGGQKEDEVLDIPEMQAYADPAKRKQQNKLIDKARAIASTIEGRQALKEGNYKNFSIENMKKFIKSATDYKKEAEDYHKARRLVSEEKMDPDSFARRYNEKGWAKFDEATANENYKGEYQQAVDKANKRKEKNMVYTDAVLELTGAPALQRIAEDPIGTAKGVGQTIGDLATLPYGVAKGAYNYATNGNFDMGTNAFGQKYGEGFNETMDVLSVLPFVGSIGKGTNLAKPVLIKGTNKLGKTLETELGLLSKSAPKGNMYGENQVLTQQTRLLNPKIKAKFFENQAPARGPKTNMLEKVPSDLNNRITPQNYDDFVKNIHSSTDYNLSSFTGKQPHNLGIGSYGKPGMVYSDAPLNNLGKDIINAHEKNHGIFAGTLSKEMSNDLLKPFGTNRAVPHYADKHQADEVLARMAQFKNAVGIGDNQTFTLGHLDLIRKNYPKNFLDNSITEMLAKIKPGSKGEKEFLKNMNKYAFGIGVPTVIGAGSNSLQQEKDGGFIEVDLTDEEIEEYRKGGYIIEELSKAQEGVIVGKKLIPMSYAKVNKTKAPIKKLPVTKPTLPTWMMDAINSKEIAEPEINFAMSASEKFGKPISDNSKVNQQPMQNNFAGNITNTGVSGNIDYNKLAATNAKNINVKNMKKVDQPSTIMNTIEKMNLGQILPDIGIDDLETQKSYLNRFLEKKGIINPKELKLKTNNVKIPEGANTFYQELGTVQDNRSMNSSDSLLSYRNQYDANKGFIYLTAPVKKDRTENKIYNNVEGVGHFVLDASPSLEHPYIHANNFSYLRKAIENNDYIPIYESTGKKDEVKVSYKRAKDIDPKILNKIVETSNNISKYNSDSDRQKIADKVTPFLYGQKTKIISPLRQMKFDEIKFDQTQKPEGFVSSVKELKKANGEGTYLLFKDRDAYSRFSGGSVTFLFKDKNGNTIAREFAGTINDIENEGLNIKKEFGLKPNELTLGYNDVGSFSAKPKAKNNVLSTDQWKDYNNSSPTGAALIIPKQNTKH